MKKNQRFIAGAQCPNCQSMDSLLLNQDDQSIQCVDCGYTQTPDERENKQKQAESKPNDTNKIDIKLIND